MIQARTTLARALLLAIAVTSMMLLAVGICGARAYQPASTLELAGLSGIESASPPYKVYVPVAFRPASGWGDVVGKVQNASTGLPIAGAQLCGGAAQCTTTDSQGNYALRGLPEGQTSVTASAQGYSPLQNAVNVVRNQTTVSNFPLSAVLVAPEMRIVLTWGANPRDLDSHLWLPASNPYHVYYSTKGSSSSFPWATLDMDNRGLDPVNDTGKPETISIKQPYVGKYIYAVKLFTGTGTLSTSGAVIRVYNFSGLLAQWSVPAGTGDWWYVFDMDGATEAITPRNVIQSGSPAPY